MPLQPDRLEHRFERLRAVVSAWEIRYNQLPEQVISLFEASDLNSIAELMREKRQLERLIPPMWEFIRKWEDTDSDSEQSLYSSARAIARRMDADGRLA